MSKEDREWLDDKFGPPTGKDSIKKGKRQIVRLKEPDKAIDKAEWDKVIKKNFPDLWSVADIVLAGAAQLLFKEIVNPFGLVLVDKPSSGKTIVLNFFAGERALTYPVDNFTPAAFISQAASIRSDTLHDVDMLPKVKDRILLVRDLAPVLSKRDEDLMASLGILTRIFDGEGAEVASGVHGKRGYAGTFMFVFVAASTPIRPKVWKTMSTLGSRLFFVNVGSKEKSIETLADQLTKKPFKEKERECREATTQLLRSLWQKYPNGFKWDPSKTKKEHILMISKIAVMLARFRGTVSVWPVGDGDDTRFNHTIPEDERPDRINQILYNFTRAHAVVHDRDAITKSDLKATLRLALESGPYHRTRLFKALIKNKGKLDSEQVEGVLNCSRPTALKEMRHLAVLGMTKMFDYGEEYEHIGKSMDKSTILLQKKFKWLVDCSRDWPDLFEV